MRIKTPEDWWALVDSEWDNLFAIIKRYVYENEWDDVLKVKDSRNWEILSGFFETA